MLQIQAPQIPIIFDYSNFILTVVIGGAVGVLVLIALYRLKLPLPDVELGTFKWEILGRGISIQGITTRATVLISPKMIATLRENLDKLLADYVNSERSKKSVQTFLSMFPGGEVSNTVDAQDAFEGKLYFYATREEDLIGKGITSSYGKYLIISTKNVENPDYHDLEERTFKILPPRMVSSKKVICNKDNFWDLGEELIEDFHVLFVDPIPMAQKSDTVNFPDLHANDIGMFVTSVRQAAINTSALKTHEMIEKAQEKSIESKNEMIAELKSKLTEAQRQAANNFFSLRGSFGRIAPFVRGNILEMFAVLVIGYAVGYNYLPQIARTDLFVSGLLGMVLTGAVYSWWNSRKWGTSNVESP